MKKYLKKIENKIINFRFSQKSIILGFLFGYALYLPTENIVVALFLGGAIMIAFQEEEEKEVKKQKGSINK